MAFASYDDLQAALAKWLKRNNLDDQIPDFIALAEVRLNRLLRTQQQIKTWYYTPTVDDSGSVYNNGFFNLPSDCLQVKRVQYGSTVCQYIPQDSASDYNLTANNYMYTIMGMQIWMQTMINGSDTVRIDYYQSIQSLDDTNESNWLLQDAYDIYLYASLLEASPYLVNDDRIATWQALLTEAINNITSASKKAAIGGGKLVVKRA